VARAVHLLQVKFLAKPAVPHLHEQRSIQVEKPVRFEVCRDVGWD
jgi:hypothetical protein